MLIIIENKPKQTVELPRITGRRAIVTMAAGQEHTKLSGYSLPFIKRYAEKCNAELHIIPESEVSELPHPAHGKKYINKWLQEGYRVCWIDIDVLVKPETPDIFEEVPIGTLGIVDRGSYIDPAHIMHPNNLMPTYLQKLRACSKATALTILNRYNYRYYNTGVFVCDSGSFPLSETEDIPVLNWQWEFFEQTYFNLQIYLKNIRVTELPWIYNAVDGMIPSIGTEKYLLANSYMRHYTSSKASLIEDAKGILT